MGAALPGVAMLQQWVGRISSQRPTVSEQVLLDIKHQAPVMCNTKLIYLALYCVYVAKLGGGQCCSGNLSESGAALCLTQPVPVAPANAPQRTAEPLRQGDGTSEKIWVRKDKKQGNIGERQSFKHQGKKKGGGAPGTEQRFACRPWGGPHWSRYPHSSHAGALQSRWICPERAAAGGEAPQRSRSSVWRKERQKEDVRD